MKSYLVLIMAQLIFATAFSQEFLNDLEFNPALINKTVERQATHKSANAKLSLPFFDDFSVISGYPNPDLWENDDVFINATYGINPPSIGVATFDAVNANGYIYESLSVSTSPADRLTSNIIDMSSADMATSYLSFYYQPQGYGNAPEKNDSLVLNVISKDSVYRIWYANGTDYESFLRDVLKIDSLKVDRGNLDTLEFKLVHLKLDNPEFFTDSFQIQFVNYANIPTIGSRPSDRTNKDHWHIDYVKLDDNRSDSDTVFTDLAMVEPPTHFLRDYSSMPWSHYNLAIDKQIVDIKYHIRNNARIPLSMNELPQYVTDLSTGNIYDYYISQKTFAPFENNDDLIGDASELTSAWHGDVESVEFEISGEYETTSSSDLLQNNIAKRTVKFDDYYAYDDGTAEKVYGVDADRAKVAYKYNTYKGDSLKAVQMYFARNKEEEKGVENFTLCVWDDYDGKPGELIRAETGKRPIIGDNLNEFCTIYLDSSLYVEGTFYIGWKQNSDLLMSVGFDANTKRRERIFFNVNSTWYNTEFEGSLMMRPVFGEREYDAPKKAANIALEIMPNPSSGHISIIDNDGEDMQGVIHVFNYLGRKVYEQNANESESINLSHLNNGMYIVTFFPNNARPRSTRLVISK
ncbi:MAG: T9SS type A sorting domain-containing protein [Salinivirgaceae bacterium]|jgi:hypothetical protein|nr:T9SS type A sorting domain-containing protein [Salinivirgaceae bacterium]